MEVSDDGWFTGAPLTVLAWRRGPERPGFLAAPAYRQALDATAGEAR